MNQYNNLVISKQTDEEGRDNIILIKNDKVLFCGLESNKEEIRYILDKFLDFF